MLSEIRAVISQLEFEREVAETHLKSRPWPRKASRPQKIDIQELFAGTMPFTLRAGRFGLVALEPSDLVTGWDYHNPHDYDIVLSNIERHEPILVIAGVECTPWCWFNVMVNYKDQPEFLVLMEEVAVVFLLMIEEASIKVLGYGGHMFMENPVGSTIFDHRVAKRILELRIEYQGRVRRVVYVTADM